MAEDLARLQDEGEDLRVGVPVEEPRKLVGIVPLWPA